MNTIHKTTTQEKHVIHPLMSKQHNDIINVITKKITIKV